MSISHDLDKILMESEVKIFKLNVADRKVCGLSALSLVLFFEREKKNKVLNRILGSFQGRKEKKARRLK